eukprot:m.16268 g.16268  ORF g.16268 m.16268 type:complete len:121 (+) comp7009_c0_seq1:322-684(+)
MAEKKQYKWEVRAGGTLPADSLSVKHATEQKGSTSIVKSLKIDKGGETAPTIDSSAMGVAHATSVPDPTFNQREFAKGEGKPTIDDKASSVAHAVAAPKPPRTIGTVDKSKMVSNNASGY